MVQATELLLTSRPETMRHFALLTQLVTLLCSQAATRDFFPSFLLRANDNEVYIAAASSCLVVSICLVVCRCFRASS